VIRYTREKHAAHGLYGQPGWDLECWDVEQVPGASRPAEVPADATRDYGYVTAAGVRHSVYRRRAPMSDHPGCAICAAAIARLPRQIRPLAKLEPSNDNGGAR